MIVNNLTKYLMRLANGLKDINIVLFPLAETF